MSGNRLGFHHSRQSEILARWGVGGIIIPSGSICWDAYPSAANPASLSHPAAGETDSAFATLVANGAITDPYYLTHYVLVKDTATGGAYRTRTKYRTPVAGTNVIRTCRAECDGPSGVTYPTAEIVGPPAPITGGDGIEVAIASQSATAATFLAYCVVLKQQPIVVPDLAFSTPTVAGAVYPTTAAPTAPAAGSAAWVYGTASDLAAAIAASVLVTSVTLYYTGSTANISGQVALQTDGTDWGVFPFPGVDMTDNCSITFNLLPFPCFVPQGSTISARIREATATGQLRVGIEYIPIPLR